jgi:hypothetical protein
MDRIALCASLVACLACGGRPDLAAFGPGLGGSGGGGSGGSPPLECAVASDQAPPFPLRLTLENSDERTLYLRETCRVRVEISACVDDYLPHPVINDCAVDCLAQPTACGSCGICPETGVPLAPGDRRDIDWTGLLYTFDTNTSGCVCFNQEAAPPGRYRVHVPVFVSEMTAASNLPAQYVFHDFVLPPESDSLLIALTLP